MWKTGKIGNEPEMFLIFEGLITFNMLVVLIGLDC